MFNKEKYATKMALTITTWRVNYILMIFKVIAELPHSVNDKGKLHDFPFIFPFPHSSEATEIFFSSCIYMRQSLM